MLEIRPVLEKVVTDVCAAVCPRTMVVADLGCSSGPNALRFVSDVIRVTGDCCRRSRRDPPELQFFLNDMPGNDFNSLFRSFARRSKKMAISTLCGWIARLVLHKAFPWPYRPFLPFLLQPHVALPGILPTQCPSLAEDPYVVLSYVEVFSLILLCSYQQSCRLIAKYT